jgi:hypothetical protein
MHVQRSKVLITLRRHTSTELIREFLSHLRVQGEFSPFTEAYRGVSSPAPRPFQITIPSMNPRSPTKVIQCVPNPRRTLSFSGTPPHQRPTSKLRAVAH